MRSAIALCAVFAVAFVFGGDATLAQTTQPAKLSSRVLLRQDSDECAKQADRHRLDLFADCMGKRQTERKAAAKQKAAADRAAKRKTRKQYLDDAVRAHQELNEKRLAALAQERVKRSDCKKQAAEQKLHFVKRLRFIEKCFAAK